MASRGYLMFAHNNQQVDYGLMALCNALMIRANSEVKNVALVTDQGTLDWLTQTQDKAVVKKAFHKVIIAPPPPGDTQMRRYQDTQYSGYDLPWHNGSRASAYELSPYKETVVLDTDYLICDNVLDQVWGSTAEVRMNRQAITLNHEPVPEAETRLEPFGIPMYWATCVYFRKGKYSQTFFDLVEVVRENYDYYQFLYRFPGRLFRNDYAFSIAAHIMSGWVGDEIEPLPNPTLLSSFDCDDLLDVPARNEFLFLVQDATETWKYRPSRVRNMSTHVMNKFSLLRNAPKIIEIYGGAE